MGRIGTLTGPRAIKGVEGAVHSHSCPPLMSRAQSRQGEPCWGAQGEKPTQGLYLGCWLTSWLKTERPSPGHWAGGVRIQEGEGITKDARASRERSSGGNSRGQAREAPGEGPDEETEAQSDELTDSTVHRKRSGTEPGHHRLRLPSLLVHTSLGLGTVSPSTTHAQHRPWAV